MFWMFNSAKIKGTNGQPTHPLGALSEDKSALIYDGPKSHCLRLQAARGTAIKVYLKPHYLKKHL